MLFFSTSYTIFIIKYKFHHNLNIKCDFLTLFSQEENGQPALELKTIHLNTIIFTILKINYENPNLSQHHIKIQ